MFKAFCLATKNPHCQNGWPTFDTTHASNKKEKAVKLLVMILNLVWKMSCKTAVSRRPPPRLAFFCADKSLIQHTHTEIVHYIKNMKNDAFQKAAKESRLKVCHISWVDETQPSDSILKKLPDIRGKSLLITCKILKSLLKGWRPYP